MTTYPAKIDNLISLPPAVNLVTPVNGAAVNNLRDAIIAVQTTLGINPAGTSGNLSSRLNTLENAVIAIGGGFVPTGDLGGTTQNTKVVGIQGRPVASTAPTINQVFLWTGASWVPSDIPGSVVFAGDLSGNSTTQTVKGLQGKPLSATAPTTNQFINYSGTTWEPTTPNATGDITGGLSSQTVSGIQGRSFDSAAPTQYQFAGWTGTTWAPLTITEDMVQPGFQVTFAFASPFTTLVEVSQSIVNPAFAATYSPTPSAAHLTDSESGHVSKDVLIYGNNFNSDYTFVKNVPGQSTTFTLTTTATSTISKTTTMTWTQRVYFGVANTPGTYNEAFIESLPGNALATSRARTFTANAVGPTARIYYAYRTAYGPATFTVGGFAGGFHLVNNFSVTNAFGFNEAYALYESDNVNLGSTTVVVS